MEIYETCKEQFIISTDKSKLDVELIHDFLANKSYWAKNIPLETVVKSMEGSFCFGVYVKAGNAILTQVGFARVVTDYATFGYLADVFIVDDFRGRGLSKWLMQEIMDQPVLQSLRRWMLATKDAHSLYTPFGFLPLDKPEYIMGFKPFEEYPKNIS